MPAGSMVTRAARWIIGGRIQGVGFRPFAFLLANELGISGSVRNHGGHVEIVAHGDRGRDELFLQRLLSDHPSIASPELISVEPCNSPAWSGFRILPSAAGADAVLLPDQSVCDACLSEMARPTARRYRYPFITCTQCGPRYTILRDVPFDRAATEMAAFPLCLRCLEEYHDPADRRFHAQVMACPDCGPGLRFRNGSCTEEENEAALSRTIEALKNGAIVAVKGIGGYHLICDASNDGVVRRLRERKRRPTKPLAVLFPRQGPDGLDRLLLDCVPDALEAQSLRSSERPIVLVSLRAETALSPMIAPGLTEIGAFLPHSPLLELLAGAFGGPLVATSGNVNGEPVIMQPFEAEQQLAVVADAFLHHDRAILRMADDGVVRMIGGRARPFRLGRGSAPLERALPRGLAEPVLALGGQMKVTLALGFNSRAVISPHLGNLDSPAGLDRLEAAVESMQRLCGVRARSLVCDAHGGYTSARWARESEIPLLKVLHHHAHAAAVAGEFAEEKRWLCFTWDGVGLGEDGTLWGGEALLGQPGSWQRVASFRAFAPPGAERAAREPWRSAAALTWELGIDWGPPNVDVALTHAAWRKRLNCPLTSSVGRLFDAAAALLQLVLHAHYEGEGPMNLEALAEASEHESEPVGLPLHRRADGLLEADWAPLVGLLLDQDRSRSNRAAAFQASLVLTLVDQAIQLRRMHGGFAVGLAGGVFQNRYVSEMSLRALKEAGFRAYLPIQVPCNDAGLSFGQLIEAAARA